MAYGLTSKKVALSHAPLAVTLSPCHPDPPAHVRFGSKADMCGALADIRFNPEIAHWSAETRFSGQFID
jgi:hypothetical protein